MNDFSEQGSEALGKALQDHPTIQQLHMSKCRIEDKDVLRAFHPGVLNMREGGTRRVRLCVADPDFGYREPLRLMDPRKWGLQRDVGADWILDIELTLVAVAEHRPRRWPWERTTLATDAASK